MTRPSYPARYCRVKPQVQQVERDVDVVRDQNAPVVAAGAATATAVAAAPKYRTTAQPTDQYTAAGTTTTANPS